jgi:HlyD family secretion protein
MAKDNSSNTNTTAVKGRWLRSVGFVVLVVLVGLAFIWLKALKGSGEPKNNLATHVTQRGPLAISVLESGTIKARDQIIIKNEVEGRTSIITLIPEGTLVKQGDLLVELDASFLEDSKIDQEIRVQNAEAAYINANENLAVVRNQAESDIDKAKLTVEFAEQDLKQYREGKYPNELAAAENRITLAQEELTRAQETLKWSQKLYDEKYISQTELQADQLAERRKSLDLELAKNDLELLQNFTYQRNIAQLESDLSQAKMALERITRKAKADIVQAEADLKAKNAEYNRQKAKLAKIEDQIKKTKIYAPAEGLVIYATSARSGGWRQTAEPLDEGQEVRERQELIYLPTTESALAEVNVHESNLEKVKIGLPAIISIEAVPGKKFLGHVVRIAPLPDAQSMWMNPDLKVYNTEIHLENSGSELRTGMSCQAEIIIERYEDAVYIPVQAVLRVKGKPTVYVLKGDSVEPREVEVGLDNNRMIRIIRGLEKGEVVLLTPPLEEGTLEATTGEAGLPKPLPSDTIPPPKASGRAPEGRTAPPEVDKNRGAAGLPAQQRDETRRKLENMPPEERKKEIERMGQRLRDPSPEERKSVMRRFQPMVPEGQGSKKDP